MDAAEQQAMKEYYLRFWTQALASLLGWSEEQVNAWPLRAYSDLDNPNDMIYHGEPEFWIAPLLIPPALRAELRGLALVDLEARLIDAFSDVDQDLATVNWDYYRQRIDTLLRDFNASLPPISQP